MKKFYYDMHLHSCLSPCADDDMTPNNICGMAQLTGLNIVALTDHNTCGNCETFLKVARKHGLVGVAGMELTTAEDIHIICLFEFLDKALAFSDEVQKYRIPFPNNEKLYGKQMYMDEFDNVTAIEENFLPMATTLGLEEAAALAESFDAVCYPAHIDRMANGIVAILGTIPDEPRFDCVEFNSAEDIEKYKKDIPSICNMISVINSDAHNLWSINESVNYIELDDEPYSSDKIRSELFKYLRSGKEQKK